jgi:hypothetical protein
MISWASWSSRFDALKAERGKLEGIDAGSDAPDRVSFRERVVEALRQEARLVTVGALDMPHNSPQRQ